MRTGPRRVTASADFIYSPRNAPARRKNPSSGAPPPSAFAAIQYSAPGAEKIAASSSGLLREKAATEWRTRGGGRSKTQEGPCEAREQAGEREGERDKRVMRSRFSAFD